jgi:hypothetical protein
MITKKAWKMADKARHTYGLEGVKLANAAFKELFSGRSKPTQEEFGKFASGLIGTGDVLWMLCEYMIRVSNGNSTPPRVTTKR